MMSKERKPIAFDPLLGFIEQFSAANAAEIQVRADAVRTEISRPIHEGLQTATSRSAQFQLVRLAVQQGTELFRIAAEPISKETLMSIARRAPSAYLHGADLTLATLLVRFAASNSSMSFAAPGAGEHNLGIICTEDELFDAFRLMAIATAINQLEDMARWLGKGGCLIALGNDGLGVDRPDEVRAAVDAYERRRPKGSVFDSGGFFLRQPPPNNWSDFRTPTLVAFDKPRFFESPKGSDRWLLFERWPAQLDAGGLARLFRGYDAALKESWGVGADHILHFLTALATLIHHSSPRVASFGDEGEFAPDPSPEQFEHQIGFIFGLARKGFLRLPRAALIANLGRVRTVLAQDAETSKRIGAEFVDAFLYRSEQADLIDSSVTRYTPFLHRSTDEHIYVDLLLLWDFLAGVLERAKQWYASQHGDRFVLDLKQWLDVEAPGFVLGAKLPVRLPSGRVSDADLLVKAPDGVWVVECKAYGKSPEFMVGAPDAVTARRKLIRDAVRQADRIAEALSTSVTLGETVFSRDTRVTAIVCTPSVEFLKPLNEHGMVSECVPRVMTPEELLQLAPTLANREQIGKS